MRARWSTNGQGLYYVQAFIYVFMLQGIFSLIVNSASLYTIIYTISPELVWTDWVGMAIWLFGFVFEVVGDE